MFIHRQILSAIDLPGETPPTSREQSNANEVQDGRGVTLDRTPGLFRTALAIMAMAAIVVGVILVKFLIWAAPFN